MSEIVSFRCSEKLDEVLQELADERLETKSTVAQKLLAEHIRDCMDEPEGEEPVNTGDDTRKLPETVTSSDGTFYEFEFDRKAAAEAVRVEFSEYVHDSDDKRMTFVRLDEDTPENVLKQVYTRTPS